MAKVYMSTPRTITIEYRQERADKDYGSCMWATFVFDLDNYSMSIMSDCGSYAHGWRPTPNTESFIHLLCRFDSGYLLNKLSTATDILECETGKALWAYIKDCEAAAEIQIEDYEIQEAMEARGAGSDSEFLQIVHSALDYSSIRDELDDYYLSSCVQTDYPLDAKKIVQIFTDYIQPFLRGMKAE